MPAEIATLLGVPPGRDIQFLFRLDSIEDPPDGLAFPSPSMLLAATQIHSSGMRYVLHKTSGGRRSERLKNLNEALTEVDALNHRQQAVIDHLVRNPFPGVTIKGHAASHAVSNLTARKDLTQLVEHGLLRSVRAGREKQYRPGDRLVGLARE